jgi:hypothetical protein
VTAGPGAGVSGSGAQGLVQVPKQLADSPATGRRCRVATQDVDDGGCREPAGKFDTVRADGSIIASR